MQAALGRQQILKISDILDRRRRNFNRLKTVLAADERLQILDAVHSKAVSSHYCLTAILRGGLAAKRDELVLKLNGRGVGTSIYYPQPVPRMTYYKNKYGYNAADCPNAATISDNSVALPVGPHLHDDDVDHIGETVLDTLKEINA